MSYTILRTPWLPTVVGALLLSAQPAAAGPPWIAVEVPSNPHHASTRDATFLVRAYHHSAALDVPLTARAEGLLNGKRESVKLAIERTHQPGVYAVRSKLAEGTWVVVVTLKESEQSTASALVTLGREGQVVAVRVPSDRTRDGWVVPRAVTAADVEGELRAAVRTASLDARAGSTSLANAGALGLLVLAALIGAARRRAAR
jgi:hypothetical protein